MEGIPYKALTLSTSESSRQIAPNNVGVDHCSRYSDLIPVKCPGKSDKIVSESWPILRYVLG